MFLQHSLIYRQMRNCRLQTDDQYCLDYFWLVITTTKKQINFKKLATIFLIYLFLDTVICKDRSQRERERRKDDKEEGR